MAAGWSWAIPHSSAFARPKSPAVLTEQEQLREETPLSFVTAKRGPPHQLGLLKCNEAVSWEIKSHVVERLPAVEPPHCLPILWRPVVGQFQRKWQ